MTSDECRLVMAAYLAGQLGDAERAQFEMQMTPNAELREEVEELRAVWEGLGSLPQEQPSAALRARFYQKLNAAAEQNRRSAGRQFAWLKIPAWAQLTAALGVFLLGMYVEHLHITRGVPEQELSQMRSQVQQLREMVALSLLDRQSVTSRLEGVAWISRVEKPDGDLLAALLSALNSDPNVNVRLSSLDALEKFSGAVTVRKALVDSIPRQESPLMQIALIDALVQIRDNAASTELKKLTGNVELQAVVRQRAQWGLEKLGFQ